MRLLSVILTATIAGFLAPLPARAAVRFDPVTNTGHVDAADVRKAFGWDDAALRANASRIGFTFHETVEELYDVVCDRNPPVEVSHNPGSTSADLTVEVTRGTGGEITGFRFTGASSGASSMTALPSAGDPCTDGPGEVVRRVSAAGRTTTRTLTASFGGTDRDVLQVASAVGPPPLPAPSSQP